MGLQNFLKQKRIESGLSQKDVAEKLGYTTSQFVSNWERGISIPPKSAINVLIDIYKIDKDQFIEVYLNDKIDSAKRSVDRIFA